MQANGTKYLNNTQGKGIGIVFTDSLAHLSHRLKQRWAFVTGLRPASVERRPLTFRLLNHLSKFKITSHKCSS